jgi:hypothetical protein
MASAPKSNRTNTARKNLAKQMTGSSVWAQQIGDNELHCRDLGHNWQPNTASENARKHLLTQSLRCPRCTTIRNRVVSAYSGEVLRTNYIYPQTYLAPRGVGWSADVRGTLRVASIRRVIEAAQEAASKTAALSTNVVDINNGKTK